MGQRASLLSAGPWLALAIGCQSNPTTTASSAQASEPTAAQAIPLVAPTVVPQATRDEAAKEIPAWATGKWSASATTRSTELQLPGNQGVQIAWLKDKGQHHSGEVKLSLTLEATGTVNGELSGVLGNLAVVGIWPAQGPMHLELRPSRDGADVFHGTLTLTWDAETLRARGILRATSGDGHWLRSAELEVTRAS